MKWPSPCFFWQIMCHVATALTEVPIFEIILAIILAHGGLTSIAGCERENASRCAVAEKNLVAHVCS